MLNTTSSQFKNKLRDFEYSGLDFHVPENFRKSFINVVGASVAEETRSRTFAYRWIGEDTLTWGNPIEWILINWIENVFFNPSVLSSITGSNDNLRIVNYLIRILKLQDFYTFTDFEEISAFLSAHPNITPVLREAIPHLTEFFGSNVKVVLDTANDPEGTTNSKQMFGYIQTEFSPEDSFKYMNLFDDAWFIDQFQLVEGLFNFILV